MKTLTVNSKFRFALASGVVMWALAFASFGAASIYADSAGSTSTGFVRERQAPEGWLEKAYQRELKGLEVQQTHLNWANKSATELQTWIDKLNRQGIDTSDLTNALRLFQGQVVIAQSAHDTASGLLSLHAGFDANGNVTDTGQARQTVMAARQSLLEAHTVLKQAVDDLHQSIREFREAHQLKFEGTPQ